MARGERVQVLVPALVGLEVIAAYKIALVSGVAITDANRDLPLPLRGVIIAQQPVAGTPLWSGDPVTVWLRPIADRAAVPGRGGPRVERGRAAARAGVAENGAARGGGRGAGHGRGVAG